MQMTIEEAKAQMVEIFTENWGDGEFHGGPFWFDVIERADFRCEYCGEDIYEIHQWHQWEGDHLIPKSKGGGEEFDNKVCACMKCNRSKGTFDPTTVTDKRDRASLLAVAKAKVLHRLRDREQRYKDVREAIAVIRAHKLGI